MTRPRAPRPRLLLAAPVVVLALVTSAWAQEPSRESAATARSRAAGLGRTDISSPVAKEALGRHGDLIMSEQEKALDALLAARSPERPERIDPAFLRFVTPKDNATTPERVALGRKLYFETRLSSDGTVSCATCHDVSRGFTDQRPTSVGVKDQIGHRNAPTVLNALLFETQFLDGRAPTLEEQAKLPITNPIEMGQPDGPTAVRAIAKDPEYVRLFGAAYGRGPNFEDAARAIAAFERTLVFLDSPFRRFASGDAQALSAEARRGWDLYNGKARCVSCHPLNPSNAIGSDNRFHNVGVSARNQNFEKMAKQALAVLEKGGDTAEQIDRLALETELSELGRFLTTKDRADIGAFKTLQVANVGVTAPYMHDGSMRTLWDVMDHYNKGGETNGYLDGGIEPLALSEKEIDDVVAFLFSLTDVRFADFNRQELERQRQIAKSDGGRPFRDTALAERKTLPFEERVMGAPKGGK